MRTWRRAWPRAPACPEVHGGLPGPVPADARGHGPGRARPRGGWTRPPRQVIRLVEWDAGSAPRCARPPPIPCCCLGCSWRSVILVCVHSLPAIIKLLEELDVALPLVTRVFLALGACCSRPRLGAAGAAAALWLGAGRRRCARPAFRLGWDTALLRPALVGPLATRLALARFARSLPPRMPSGIPLVQALRHSEQVTGNARWAQASAAIRRGGTGRADWPPGRPGRAFPASGRAPAGHRRGDRKPGGDPGQARRPLRGRGGGRDSGCSSRCWTLRQGGRGRAAGVRGHSPCCCPSTR